MIKLITLLLLILSSSLVKAQQPETFKLSKTDLSGENLNPRMVNGQLDHGFYQRQIYNGSSLLIYVLAIDNRTNELQDFPIEEFVFWMNGKAEVDPLGESAFEVQKGDYFIQPKGFNGKWTFVGGDPLHLELSVISKVRAAKSAVSPISQTLIIDEDIISGSSSDHMDSLVQLYSGAELILNLIRIPQINFENNPQERLVHVLNGILTIESITGTTQSYYTGDFIVIPIGYQGTWKSTGSQALRVLELTSANP